MNRSRTQPKLSIPSNTEPSLKELTTFYKKDKRIFNFLQKNDAKEHRKTQKHIRSESHSLLKKIKSLFNLNRDLSFNQNKYDNRKFLNDFQKAKKQEHLKPPREAFKYLIKEYSQRGYKIPNLSLKHNLFNPNPLAENKRRRLIQTFIVADSKRKHKIRKNSLKYLKKIKDMVTELIQFYKKEQSDLSDYIKTKPQGSVLLQKTQKGNSVMQHASTESNEESTPKLLKQISKLINMLNDNILNKLDDSYNNNSKTSPKKRMISNLDYKYNEKEDSICEYLKPKRQSAIINFKRNSNFNSQQSRNQFNQPHRDIRQIKKQTFEFMNLQSLTNRSGIDLKNTTSIFEGTNTVPYFLLSPKTKKRNTNAHLPGLNSFASVSSSSVNHKIKPSFCSQSSLRINPYDQYNHNYTNTNNTKTKSFISNSDSFNISASTNFKTFKSGLGLGLSIRTNLKTQSELIAFAYEKCKEQDYVAVKTALRILLEKFKEKSDEQIDTYFDELFNNVESNVIIKHIDITKKIINNSNIENKIKQLYSTDELKSNIKPKLHLLKSKNKEMNLIDKQFVKSLINKHNIK